MEADDDGDAAAAVVGSDGGAEPRRNGRPWYGSPGVLEQWLHAVGCDADELSDYKVGKCSCVSVYMRVYLGAWDRMSVCICVCMYASLSGRMGSDELSRPQGRVTIMCPSVRLACIVVYLSAFVCLDLCESIWVRGMGWLGHKVESVCLSSCARPVHLACALLAIYQFC
jgi:hypothetical protein